MQLYCKRESFFHSLDARVKLALLAVILALQILLPLEFGLALFLSVAALYSLSRISLLEVASDYRFLFIIPLLPALIRVVPLRCAFSACPSGWHSCSQ